MPTLIQKQRELFDEKFARISHFHRGECAITDTTGTKFEAATDENGKVIEVGGLKSIKSFLTTCLIEHYEEDIRELDRMKGHPCVFCKTRKGKCHCLVHDAALDLAISLLQDKIKELKK